jgi:methionyl-tRNA formyltransferase
MRLAMMGTGAFAVPTFRALYDTRHTVSLLVTQPARPVHDRRRRVANPMRELAEERRTPVLDPENVNTDEVRAAIRTYQPDLLVVCAYGQILAGETLGVTEHGGINLHSSLLPKYRGAAPINWAIYHGETETGVTVIHMTERVDAGPCIAQASVDILPDETALELAPRMAEAGAWLTCRAIDSIEEGHITEIPQDPALATLAPKLKKSDGQVDWSQSAETIRNQVRAMQPWPKTFTHWQRDESAPLSLILDAVTAEDLTLSDEPGTVIEAGKDRLLIATGSGVVRIDRIQPAGKRVLSVEEFLRGYPVKAGQRMIAGS